MGELNNEALDWDGVLENDGSEFIVLPEGDYIFEVTNMERGSFPGSEKMCACAKATLTLKITDAEHGTVNVFDDLILHKKMEWKLSQFFRAIGMKKKGERLVMDWNKVVGSSGRVHIIVNKYTAKDGSQRENNKVSKYYDYDGDAMFMTVPEGSADELPFD
ncbi:hypothetical protein D6855_16000 [Butyrivibrio sp. CB08]|uniref:hypothetical protein n=1 Tax=Butyrivibrio sp. CB08 TaxID=2364879 RepID=UPI000EAA10BF|nr:hypothetical protein [Butyrivibrio sp. CB08]RKM55435.1 hypothetical protein D6855_16000 [Butyrivibrio sp. CB08]